MSRLYQIAEQAVLAKPTTPLLLLLAPLHTPNTPQLDEEVNPDPMHELPHPPTHPGEVGSHPAPNPYHYGLPPPVPPRPGEAPPLGPPDAENPLVGGFLSSIFDSVFGRLDDPHNIGANAAAGSSDRGRGPPQVPPRPDEEPGQQGNSGDGQNQSQNQNQNQNQSQSRRGPRTRTYNWGNASFTITTGSGPDLFPPPGRNNNGAPNPFVGGMAGAPGDPDIGLDAYFRGFGAPPPHHNANRPRRGMGTEDASGAIFVSSYDAWG
jgi:hypothetical protein